MKILIRIRNRVGIAARETENENETKRPNEPKEHLTPSFSARSAEGKNDLIGQNERRAAREVLRTYFTHIPGARPTRQDAAVSSIVCVSQRFSPRDLTELDAVAVIAAG